MFIPRGKPLYENLATSYVLVDALVEDLCEGGFTGIVEVLLRDTDCHIVMSRGTVVGVTEQRSDGATSPTTVKDIAARSRGERGRVSIYGYSLDAAEAVAGRIAAEPLYSRLSTDFADPERMIRKLGREHDREWFVEVRVEGGTTGLVYLKGDQRLVLSSREGWSGDRAMLADDDAGMRDLLDECNRLGGVFDVYYRQPPAELAIEPSEPTMVEVEAAALQEAALVGPDFSGTAVDAELQEATPSLDAGAESQQEQALSAMAATTSSGATQDTTSAVGAAVEGEESRPSEMIEEGFFAKYEPTLVEPPSPDTPSGSDEAAAEPLAEQEPAAAASAPEASGFQLSDSLEVQRAAELMAEVKRLVGEIARTVEGAVSSGESKDSFAMALRAGQLKLADQYPFLDPFGSEFEYLAGEIVFVGDATPEEFIAALTEAIKLAVDSIAESSPHPSRLKARVEAELRSLLERNREEFESFGLDKSIERIIGQAPTV